MNTSSELPDRQGAGRSQPQRRADLGIWIVPGAILGGLLGLLLAIWGVETTTSGVIPGGKGEVTASGKVFGLKLVEETGPFAQVRSSVGQQMRTYAAAFVVASLLGGGIAAFGLRALLTRRTEPA